MEDKIDVSVTYTLYGDFDTWKLEVALLYLSKQKGVNFEAVIANATEKHLDLPAFCKIITVSPEEAKKKSRNYKKLCNKELQRNIHLYLRFRHRIP